MVTPVRGSSFQPNDPTVRAVADALATILSEYIKQMPTANQPDQLQKLAQNTVDLSARAKEAEVC